MNDNIVRLKSSSESYSARPKLVAERLTEARLASRLTQTEVAERIGVTRQAVSSYELGAKFPEPETMQRIARELEQPMSFFTSSNRSSFGAFGASFFRKVGADTKRRNQACAVLGRWFSESVHLLDDLANLPAVEIPQFEPSDTTSNAYTESELEDFAEATRKFFSLGVGPISNLVRLLEVKGVSICRYEMVGENVEAFSYWSGHRPFIFLASDKNSAARSRFDVAHELAHLCLHRWVTEEDMANPQRLKVIEAEANRFAGAFLLPRTSFPNEVFSSRAESFVDLKKRWKVAIQAMVYRCKDLGIFDDRQVTNLYKQISYKRWRTKEPLDGVNGLEMEQPTLFKKIVELVSEHGNITASELAFRAALSPSVLEQFWNLDRGSIADREVPDFLPTLR